jgi:hypothetical protein
MPKRRSEVVSWDREDIDRCFCETEIRRLASMAKLPAKADLARFGEAVRDAVSLYVKRLQEPNVNQIHREISALHKAALRRDFQALACNIRSLSEQARHFLMIKSQTALIPSKADFEDPAKCEEAAAIVELLCVRGGEVQMKKRRDGRQYRTLTWKIAGSNPTRTPQKRSAERDLAMWLQVACLEATGRTPGLSAHPDNPGPFARLLRSCLDMIGAKHVDAIELINSLNKQRKRSRGSNP